MELFGLCTPTMLCTRLKGILSLPSPRRVPTPRGQTLITFWKPVAGLAMEMTPLSWQPLLAWPGAALGLPVSSGFHIYLQAVSSSLVGLKSSSL